MYNLAQVDSRGEGTYVCTLDEATQEKAMRELNEDPKERASQVEQLRTWIKQQKHFKSRTGNYPCCITCEVKVKEHSRHDPDFS
jgi:hypothetical protein